MNELIKDLGLSYEAAAHGVQTAVAHRDNVDGYDKHLRTGIDLSKAEQFGLACLLIDKGVFTNEEYIEYMRLGVNTELARLEEEFKKTSGLDIQFR